MYRREQLRKREKRTIRWLLGNLVIIHRETRLYQSDALIPLGPSKITMITVGLKGDRGTKSETKSLEVYRNTAKMETRVKAVDRYF